MADLRRFAGRIRIMGERVEQNASAMVRKVAAAVDSTVVIATPVDTGRARANWQANIGSPAVGTLDNEDPSGQATISANEAKIRTYEGGSSIHLTNNLPYIGKLNDGHSAQAPVGFVETAVLVGVAAAQGAGSILQNTLREEL